MSEMTKDKARDKTIIDALFNYFYRCPLMKGNRLNIDYLPPSTRDAGVEYAIATVPTDDVVYAYKDGGARCRYPFIISSVCDYGPDEGQNLANTSFGELMATWLRKQTRIRNLPDLPNDLTARSIKSIGAGYLYQQDMDIGKYQIQCELEYYRKGDIL